MTARPQRVLVVITRRIGDVLLATPVVRSLKQAWPKASIDLLVFGSTTGVLAANADIKKVLSIPERPGLAQHLVFIGKLLRRYDLAVSLLPGDRPTLYAFLAGKKRIGLLLASPKDNWKRRLLDQWVAYDPLHTHTVRTHLSVLKPLGVYPVAKVVSAWNACDPHRVAQACATLNERPFVVLHLYPKFNYKMWREDGWTLLARWIIARGLCVVFTGGNDSDEREYVERVASTIPEAINLAGQLTLSECASVLARATAYVGPDTALTHMAAALGIPTLALFGPTDPVRWGPWPLGHPADSNPWQRIGSQRVGNVTLLQGSGACVPCGHEGCDRKLSSYSDCLQSLTVERVTKALEERLC